VLNDSHYVRCRFRLPHNYWRFSRSDNFCTYYEQAPFIAAFVLGVLLDRAGRINLTK
jgi:hypothetical protein